jgi:hypothetical protein
MLTVDIVDFEEEKNFFAVGLMCRVLVHSVQKLGQRNFVVAIFVENFKHALYEESLKKKHRISFYLTLYLKKKEVTVDFSDSHY